MRARENELLFRTIIPLLHWTHEAESPVISINGHSHGAEYTLEIVKSTGYEEAKGGILKYWTFGEVSSCELFEHIRVIGMCHYFLVIDNYAEETQESSVMSNTLASIKIETAAIKTLILFMDGLGPIIEKHWSLRSPFIGNSIGWPLVTMNPFMCKRAGIELDRIPKFKSIFNSLLSYSWEDSQFDIVFDLAYEAVSGSLRTTSYAHSFSLLTMAFETLFTKTENDWSGGSRRLARLVGSTKQEVTNIHTYLNHGEESIRNLRNLVIHGNIDLELDSIKEHRIRMAEYMTRAMISLIEIFDGSEQVDNYYEHMESAGNENFSTLPNK